MTFEEMSKINELETEVTSRIRRTVTDNLIDHRFGGIGVQFFDWTDKILDYRFVDVAKCP